LRTPVQQVSQLRTAVACTKDCIAVDCCLQMGCMMGSK